MDVLPNYGIPMNPSELQNSNDVNAPTTSSGQLISYNNNPNNIVQPIDFTDFLNIDDSSTANDDGELLQ